METAGWKKVITSSYESHYIEIWGITIAIWYFNWPHSSNYWKCRIINTPFWVVLEDCHAAKDDVFLAQVHALREAKKYLESWKEGGAVQGELLNVKMHQDGHK